jgi:hypothetical protein
LLFDSTNPDNAENSFSYSLSFGETFVDSSYLRQYLRVAYFTCGLESNQNRNSTSCQILANMCALNLYNTQRGQTTLDACTAFRNIKQINDQIVDKTSNNYIDLPWIFYTEKLDFYNELYSTSGFNSTFINVKFDDGCKKTGLQFYAAQYSLDGDLIKFDKFDFGELNLCNLISTKIDFSKESPFSLTDYSQSI